MLCDNSTVSTLEVIPYPGGVNIGHYGQTLIILES